MMMVDTDNRWVYKGSVTTPPCDYYVYWNVVRKVYPLRQKYLDQFLEQLKRGGLEKTGNNRVIQPYNGHYLHIVTTDDPPVPEGLVLAVVCLFVGILLLFGAIMKMCSNYSKA